MRRLILPLFLLLTLPASAGAAEVHVEGTTVVYTAAPGELNAFTGSLNRLEGDSNTYYVSDSVPITVGAGCEKEEFYDYTRCPLPGPGTMRVDLGDGSDTGELQVPGSLAGGAGDDKLRGRPTGPQTLDGGDGNDDLDGDVGTYCNVGGQDPVAPDVLIGGGGLDRVTYARQTAGVVVTIDDKADDGVPGEGDDVRTDVENVTAEQSCNDVVNQVTGSEGPNDIEVDGVARGQGGDDTLSGSGTLDGGAGNDQLVGFRGNDVLVGGDGDDYLEGGFGDDAIDGGAGKDSYVGDTTATNTIGVGNDTINARDGVAESVSCGPGSDKAIVDATDDVAIDTQNLCEEVDRAKATRPTGPGTSGPTFVFVAGTPVKVRKRKAKIKVTCLADAGCNGTLKLYKGKKTLASKAFSIAPGKAAKVALKVKKLRKSTSVLASASSKPPGSIVTVRVKLRK